MVEALSRAVAEPAGMPLFAKKRVPGLFAATTAGRQIAERCKEAGYLHTLQSEVKGKQVLEICTITEKGLAYVLSQLGPKQVLEDLVRTLQSRQFQVEELVTAARE